MLETSIFKDRSGEWIWEILDDDNLYMRSAQRFAFKQDAQNDLVGASHLIHPYLKSHS